MEIVVFILYSNKKLLIDHFHQETNSIVHLVEIVTFDIFLTSFAVCQESLNLRKKNHQIFLVTYCSIKE